MVGLSMAQRKAVTKEMLKRYAKAPKAEKGRMLDELCALTGWTRRHARRALAAAAQGTTDPPRRPRDRTYGADVLVPLRRVWAGAGRSLRQAPGPVHGNRSWRPWSAAASST